jgi:hypothetical protein
MTVTQGELITPAPRANHRGDPCPAWCAVDHARKIADGKGGPVYVSNHASTDAVGEEGARAWQAYSTAPPEVQVTAMGAGILTASCYVPPQEAGALASLLEALADAKATPARLRRLAASVRAAAKAAQ